MSKLKILGCLCLLLVLPAMGVAQKQSRSMVPVLNAVSPSSALAGDMAFTLTVTGANFTSGSVVQWNGSSLSTTVVNSTQLQASVGSALIASQGTAQVTVYTSGRWGGTSNTATFTINAPAAAPAPEPPPPSPDPLAITTSSLPAGNAGSSYNATLASSGGAPAITWSTASGGGSLPPGLALQANGVVTGTPTQGGTFNFTIQASDQAGQVSQRAYALSVTAPPPPPPPAGDSGILWQTGFESSDAAMDNINTAPDTLVTSTPPPGRSGNALQIHYTICGASDGTCGSSSQDKNRWASKVISPGVTHLFARGYVYFKSPENGVEGQGAQRKLMWIGDESSATSNGGSWDVILNSWESTSGAPSTMRLAVLGQGSTCYGSQMVDWMNGVPPLNWDTWYELEIEVQTNTPSSAGPYDGILRVWVNGTQVLNRTDFKVNGACTTPASFFSVGRQANRYSYQAIDEYRFWDDLSIGSSFINP